jgi:hypothetical protein
MFLAAAIFFPIFYVVSSKFDFYEIIFLIDRARERERETERGGERERERERGRERKKVHVKRKDQNEKYFRKYRKK